jgi:hypothetical protein
MTTSCPSCGRQLLVREEFYGRQVKCPACGKPFAAGTPGQYAESHDSVAGDDLEQPLEPSRRLGPRARARKALLGPAIGLIISAGVGLFVHLLFLAVSLVQLAQKGIPDPPPDPGRRNDESYRLGFQFGYCCSAFGPGVVPPIPAIIVFVGALQMMRLRSYTFSYVTAILAMLPCLGVGCLPGLGFGIWAVITLHRDDVHSAFR